MSRLKFIFLLTCLIHVNTPKIFADSELTSLKWKNRILVILSASPHNKELEDQRSIAGNNDAGFKERYLVVLTETDPEGGLHRKFKVAAQDFRVLLIGKDGHVALERSTPITAEILFSVIDSMPMRREEMKASQPR